MFKTFGGFWGQKLNLLKIVILTHSAYLPNKNVKTHNLTEIQSQVYEKPFIF